MVQQQTEEASLKLADVFERHLAIFVHGGNLKYAFEYVFVLWQKKVTKKGTSEDLVPSYVLSLMVRILLHANSCDDVLSYLRNRLSKPQLIQVTKVAALRASELGKMKRAIKLWSLPSVGQYEMAVRLNFFPDFYVTLLMNTHTHSNTGTSLERATLDSSLLLLENLHERRK